MKSIYLRIEHYKDGKFLFSEEHPATMDKDFVYVDKFKIKKADTEVIPDSDKNRVILGRVNRCIKISGPKNKDSRFIRL